MDEKITKPKDRTFKVLITAGLILLAGAVAWLTYRVETLPAASSEKPVTNESGDTDTPDDSQVVGWDTTVTSSDGTFTITFPDGWSPLTKSLDTGRFTLAGTKQPDVAPGKKVVITDIESSGSDSLSVFSVAALPVGGFAPPRGEVSEFTVGKGEDAMVGKKYIYTYAKDEVVGIGTLRLQGDRDYEYVFTMGGKEVRVFYSVYGSDPRNLINTVDEIVRTIRPPGAEGY